MTASVRPSCYETDTQAIIDTLQTNLPHLPHAKLFPWLYLRNPEGRARVWVATDPASNRMIGVASAFPRRIARAGRVTPGYVLGDFCIDSTQRSLGLALALQRACLEGLTDSVPAFAFDFPSQSMLAIYKRLKIDVNLTMVRMAKPLRADRKIAELVRNPVLARGLNLLANTGLRLRSGAGNKRGYFVTTEAGPWGEEFTHALGQWNARGGACVMRTADYLNWRYREHPLQSYELLAARRSEKLVGYLILHMHGEGCFIDDLMAEDTRAKEALLARATALALERQVHTLSAPWMAVHRDRQMFEQCGFRAREPRPVVLIGLPSTTALAPFEDWLLTNGDWES